MKEKVIRIRRRRTTRKGSLRIKVKARLKGAKVERISRSWDFRIKEVPEVSRKVIIGTRRGFKDQVVKRVNKHLQIVSSAIRDTHEIVIRLISSISSAT